MYRYTVANDTLAANYKNSGKNSGSSGMADMAGSMDGIGNALDMYFENKYNKSIRKIKSETNYHSSFLRSSQVNAMYAAAGITGPTVTGQMEEQMYEYYQAERIRHKTDERGDNQVIGAFILGFVKLIAGIF